MTHIRLIHWHAEECDERLSRLAAAGLPAQALWTMTGGFMRSFREDPPQAFVIDLSRLPSHGREIATMLRRSKHTRSTPLIFVAGQPDKVASLQTTFPDAPFTTWDRLPQVLRQAIAAPPADPVVPPSHMERFAGTPLVKKLNIPAEGRIGLIHAPPGFAERLTPWPERAELVRQPRSACQLVLWFAQDREQLERNIDRYAGLAGRGGLWIAWRKQQPKARTRKADADPEMLSQNDIFQIAHAAGLVDNKVCAIDDTWSALRFTARKDR